MFWPLCLFPIRSACVGAVATVGMCWMAAWDESMPSPQGLAQYRFGYDAEFLGGGESGEWRPAPLRWWEALTPSSWHVGTRVWPDRDICGERVANSDFSGEAKDEHGVTWRVTWRKASGLSDSFFVHQTTFVASASAGEDEPERAALNNYCDFGGEPRAPFQLPRALIDRGTPDCVEFSMETRRAWEEVPLPAWAVLRPNTPSVVNRLDLPPESRDIDLSHGTSSFAGGVVTEEVRAYGWPLRSLVTRGWRRDLEWYSSSGQEDDSNDWWSDGLGDMPPLRHPESAQLALPATGLPWNPLWLPFLANSLILGVPLTLAGFGVSRAARWGFAKFRGRGNNCPKCGYPRKGLSRDPACPECGAK